MFVMTTKKKIDESTKALKLEIKTKIKQLDMQEKATIFIAHIHDAELSLNQTIEDAMAADLSILELDYELATGKTSKADYEYDMKYFKSERKDTYQNLKEARNIYDKLMREYNKKFGALYP